MENINKNTALTTQDSIANAIYFILLGMLDDDDYLDIEVGEFDNCRESGFTYRALNSAIDFTFCVYEHRNSDQLIINGCLTKDVKHYGPYGSNDKYFSYARFSYNQHYDCASRLLELISSVVSGSFEIKESKQ